MLDRTEYFLEMRYHGELSWGHVRYFTDEQEAIECAQMYALAHKGKPADFRLRRRTMKDELVSIELETAP